MEDHPGIVFKDGPTGRRAALVRGPDVWQVVKTFKETGSASEQAICGRHGLGQPVTRTGRRGHRYYRDFPEEVDARIVFNHEGADRQYAAWKRTQQAFA